MKALSKKLVAAMRMVDAVEKTGKNEKQGYKYVKATDVAREVRKALAEQGIAFGYSVTKMERWTQQTHSGGTMNFVELWANVTFSDSESDESVTCAGVGWGMDTGDKGPYKAMTGLLKYVLRMNFMIPDESDPENDSGEIHVANGSGREIVRKSQKGPSSVEDAGGYAALKSQIGVASNGDPIFDEDGQPVVQRSAAPPVPQKPSSKFVSGSTVGIPRGKRLFAIAMGAGRSKEELNNYLGSIGVERCEEVPVSEYEKACTWAAGV